MYTTYGKYAPLRQLQENTKHYIIYYCIIYRIASCTLSCTTILISLDLLTLEFVKGSIPKQQRTYIAHWNTPHIICRW